MASEQAAAVEEGREQGKEIASQKDFMTISIESATGSMDLLESAMAAANEMLPSRADDDKRAGKMFISHGPNTLCLICHVPEEHHTTATAEDWMKAVLSGIGGEMISAGATEAKAEVSRGDASQPFLLPDGSKKDKAETVGFEATKKSVEWLRERQLFPPKEEEGDDDWEAGDVEW